MGGIIEYVVKGVHFDSKIGYLDLKILYLKQKYMIYVVRYYWKCADGHFEIQYGHHADNPRWFIIARLDSLTLKTYILTKNNVTRSDFTRIGTRTKYVLWLSYLTANIPHTIRI